MVGPSSLRLRVHLAPIGPEVLRVVEPMRALFADVALLMTVSSTDRSRFVTDKIVRSLERNGTRSQVVECDVRDTSQVVNEVGAIVSSSPQHEYFFNSSTGTRAASIGGVIAGMFWKVKPYYVEINEQAKTVNGEGDYPTRGSPQFIPTFEIPPLDKTAIIALELLAGKDEPVPKSLVIGDLKAKGVIGPRQKEEVSEQALYGQLDSILHKLETWGFIDLVGRGKQTRIRVTEKGIEGRKMFFHILNPRKPLSILEPKV